VLRHPLFDLPVIRLLTCGRDKRSYIARRCSIKCITYVKTFGNHISLVVEFRAGRVIIPKIVLYKQTTHTSRQIVTMLVNTPEEIERRF
jgi:hypothetical protein